MSFWQMLQTTACRIIIKNYKWGMHMKIGFDNEKYLKMQEYLQLLYMEEREKNFIPDRQTGISYAR